MRVFALCVFSSIVMLAYFGFWRQNPASKRVTSAIGSPDATAFKRILLGRRAPAAIPLGEPADAECQDLWTQVRSLDLQRLNEDIFRGCLLLPSNAGCQKLPSALSSLHEAYLKQCAPFLSNDVDKARIPNLDERGESCFLSLVAYRSALGAWLTKGAKLSEIDDTSILGDKLLHSMLASLRGEEVAAREVLQIADRVNELNPNVYSTSKISTVGRLMAALGEPTDANWTEAQRALEQLERFQQDDPETKMLSLWIRTQGVKPDKLYDEAKRLIAESPNSGLGYFYMAFAETGLGNRGRVESMFLSAVRAEPNNATFVRALENHRARRPVIPPFQFDFNFRITELVGRT